MNRRWLTLALLLVLVLATQVASACPNCKDALGDDPNSANLARGFYYSILFMLSMPYLVFAGIGLYFYSLIRQARREREAAAAQAALMMVAADDHASVEDDELVGAR